jgi:hypothetical protein
MCFAVVRSNFPDKVPLCIVTGHYRPSPSLSPSPYFISYSSPTPPLSFSPFPAPGDNRVNTSLNGIDSISLTDSYPALYTLYSVSDKQTSLSAQSRVKVKVNIWKSIFITYSKAKIEKNRTAQRSTAQHSTAQHSTAQRSTAQHSTAQRSTAQVRPALMKVEM